MRQVITTYLKSKKTNKEFIFKRWQVFFTAIMGYSSYYVCRLSFSIVKKPLIDTGIFTETQMGIIGSALFFSYAIGKFINGCITDRVNLRKFFALGLFLSSLICLAIGFTENFVAFAVLWGLLGWFQSMGAAPCAVIITRWYHDKERGTYYAFWSASHSLGKAITYIIVPVAIATLGWQWGFWSAGFLGLFCTIYILYFLYESPQSIGFEAIRTQSKNISIADQQKNVFKNPAVWILAIASGLMYVCRYAIESWGVFFLENEKNYSNKEAGFIFLLGSIAGIIGTIISGFISDRFFKGSRNVPTLISGILNIISLCMFLLLPKNIFLDSLSMIISGFAMGILITFLGGLMAVDIVSKQATGAVMGLIGISSYIGAGLQDVISGFIIESDKMTNKLNNEIHYDFSGVSYLWIGSAILSTLLALLVWNAKSEE
ncbi:MFS transporter [Flavobacterium sp. LAR06]|uniref:MFS transporter n=1 Tax=Flavobacterium sp. LAR06 TaxID=3064897 RepID=UPI0035BFAFFB